jgi:hypothetical protein
MSLEVSIDGFSGKGCIKNLSQLRNSEKNRLNEKSLISS